MLDYYLNSINAVLDEFVKTFEQDYSTRMGQEFMACLDENVVEWSLLYVNDGGEAFYNNFIQRFPCAQELGLFTLSLLHELGHLETEWEMVDDIEKRNSESMSDEEYFNLFNEYIATEWAGEWIQSNLEQALALDRKIKDLISEMYEKVLDKCAQV